MPESTFADTPPISILYIGGVGRSGSTLVERMLNEVPGIVGVGELFQMWSRGVSENRLCACGVPFHECEHWATIGQHAFGGWNRLDLRKIIALQNGIHRIGQLPVNCRTEDSPDHALMMEYASYCTRVYRAAACHTGAKVILDSSKHFGMARCLAETADIRLRILHLVRDPRGVAASWIKPVLDKETGQTIPAPRLAVPRCALAWLRQNSAYDKLATRLSQQSGPEKDVAILRLRYESFIHEPLSSSRSVLDFVGLNSPSTSIPDSWSQGSAQFGKLHSVSGNRMRFDQGAIRLQVDDQWRSRLSTLQQLLVRTSCFLLMRRYGYLG